MSAEHRTGGASETNAPDLDTTSELPILGTAEFGAGETWMVPPPVLQAAGTAARLAGEPPDNAPAPAWRADPDLQAPPAATQLARLKGELAATRAAAARYFERLQTRHLRASVVESVYLAQEAEVGSRDAALLRLEGELGEAQARAVALEGELRAQAGRLATLEQTCAAQANAAVTANLRLAEHDETVRELAGARALLAERDGALAQLREAHAAALARLAADEAMIRELEERITGQQDAMRALQAECNIGLARREELEADLRAAEDAVHRLESELRSRSARITELESHEAAAFAGRGSAPESPEEVSFELPALEAADRMALTDVHPALNPATTLTLPHGSRRVLVRCDENPNGAEVAHVLGRKTSIGRTPDNDLRIDASWISRHHAVILAGPHSTVIEDLNSTNGIAINGRRVTRQALEDGDELLIGRTRFRFALR